ncbi:PEP-CTERM sorting domain-containing protein [Luteolibacter marinus]|uniref:PEP-CTERM sorting domain-containing protein n=1 Tax=Luteolibacter marinus TaxID=2776705 RepID=UPI001865A9FB|nr:PEP-CTERM sorting domain-containing protein [Luteolibacter marinus]
MKKLVITLLAAMSSFAFGSTVAIGGPPANRLGVQAAAGGELLTGTSSYYLTVGTYGTAPVVNDLASFMAAVSDFVPLTAVGGAVVTLGSADAGTISGSFVGVGPDALSSAPIYIFLSNTADYTLATEIAVLRASTQVFANPVSGSGSVTVTPSVSGLVGVVGQITDVATGTDYVTMVQAVPEPSIALLGALGLFGLVRRRR